MKVELSPEARLLVEAGRNADGPSVNDLARSRSRLAAVLGVGAFAGASGLAGSTAASSLHASAHAAQASMAGAKGGGLLSAVAAHAKLATAVAVLGGGVGLGVGYWPTGASAPAETVRGGFGPAKMSANSDVELPTHDVSAGPERSTPAAKRPKEVAPEGASGTTRRLEPEAKPAAKALTPSLARELELLGAAEQRLRGGDPNGALRMLEQHARRFPEGALRQERMAARAIALCKLGRLQDGHSIARQLARSAPSSPLAARVRRACP
jgi:hypothetical protein